MNKVSQLLYRLYYETVDFLSDEFKYISSKNQGYKAISCQIHAD